MVEASNCIDDDDAWKSVSKVVIVGDKTDTFVVGFEGFMTKK